MFQSYKSLSNCGCGTYLEKSIAMIFVGNSRHYKPYQWAVPHQDKKVSKDYSSSKWHILWQGKVIEEGIVSKTFGKEYFNSACISQNDSELHEFDAIKT